MAQTFALIDSGTVTEIVRIQPGEPGLEARYHAAIVESAVELHGSLAHTVQGGWNYDGNGFSQPAPPGPTIGPRYVQVPLIRERMEELGLWENLTAILQSQPAIMLKVVTLRDGVDADDPEARALLIAAGADPDVILAP